MGILGFNSKVHMLFNVNCEQNSNVWPLVLIKYFARVGLVALLLITKLYQKSNSVSIRKLYK